MAVYTVARSQIQPWVASFIIASHATAPGWLIRGVPGAEKRAQNDAPYALKGVRSRTRGPGKASGLPSTHMATGRDGRLSFWLVLFPVRSPVPDRQVWCWAKIVPSLSPCDR